MFVDHQARLDYLVMSSWPPTHALRKQYTVCDADLGVNLHVQAKKRWITGANWRHHLSAVHDDPLSRSLFFATVAVGLLTRSLQGPSSLMTAG